MPSALSHRALKTRDVIAAGLRFDPLLNEPVFGRVNLAFERQCFLDQRMVCPDRRYRHRPAVAANSKMFFNPPRLTVAQASENEILKPARVGVRTPHV
jgi:hypothetical protein